MSVLFGEYDILAGRNPAELKTEDVKLVWLRCRNDSAKGLRAKAELVK